MNNDLISVIVPVYNVSSYLDKCIESIINQSYKNLEIILIDDGSGDCSGSICDKWAKIDNRIRVIHKSNEGLGFTRNVGIKNSNGRYIAFVDSDDFIESNMYELLIDNIDDSDAVFCGLNRVLNNEKKLEEPYYSEKMTFNDDEIYTNVLLKMLSNGYDGKNKNKFYMSVWHALYSADLIKTNEIYFRSERDCLSEDIFFHIEFLSKAHKVVSIPDNLYNYVVNPNSLTMIYDNKRFLREIKLHKMLIEELSAIYSFNTFITFENSRFLDNLHGRIISTCIDNEKNKKQRIKEIINNEDVCLFLKQLRGAKLPIKRRIFNILIMNKLTSIIIFMVKFVYGKKIDC